MQKASQINNLIQIIKRHRRQNQQCTVDGVSPRNTKTTISNQLRFFKNKQAEILANKLQLNSFRYIKDNNDEIHRLRMQIKTKSERKNKSQPKQRLSTLIFKQKKGSSIILQSQQRYSCRMFRDTIKQESGDAREYKIQEKKIADIKNFKQMYSLQDRIDEIFGKNEEKKRYGSTDASPVCQTSIRQKNGHSKRLLKQDSSFHTLEPNTVNQSKSKIEQSNLFNNDCQKTKQTKTKDNNETVQPKYLKFGIHSTNSPLSQLSPSPGSPQLSPHKISQKESKFPKMLLKHKINKYSKYCQNLFERYTYNQIEQDSICSPKKQKQKQSEHHTSLVGNPTKHKTKDMLKLIIYEQNINNSINKSVASQKSSKGGKKLEDIHSQEYKLYQMKYIDLNASILSKINNQQEHLQTVKNQEEQKQTNHILNNQNNIEKIQQNQISLIQDGRKEKQEDENGYMKQQQVEKQLIKKYKVDSQLIMGNNRMLNFKFKQKLIESPKNRETKQQKGSNKNISYMSKPIQILENGDSLINCKSIQIKQQNKSIISRNYLKCKVKHKYKTQENNMSISQNKQVGSHTLQSVQNNTINSNNNNSNGNIKDSINLVPSKSIKLNSSKQDINKWSTLYEDEWRNMKIEGWQVKPNTNINQYGL